MKRNSSGWSSRNSRENSDLVAVIEVVAAADVVVDHSNINLISLRALQISLSRWKRGRIRPLSKSSY